MARELRDLRKTNQTLREKLAYLESGKEIDKRANDDVRKSLIELQRKNAALQEQVAFYRGIVSPGDSAAGVRVYDVKIVPDGGAGKYRYELVLIQSVRNQRRVGGEARIKLEGLRNGKSEIISIAGSGGNQSRLKFSLRYFEEFSGQFTMDSRFKPQKVIVSVDPDGANNEIIEEYEWTKVLGD